VSASSVPLSTTPISLALDAFKQGQMLIVTDDDDREGEGDLIVAASLCTSEQMAFIVRHTSGIVCAPISPELARKLRLDPMVAVNDAPLSTAFTVSVDYRHGLTTGISAEERTATVRALANSNVGGEDFVRPGHVFPLIARSGGVLMRSGHTEAAVDLCQLAGLPPVGVICELINDDGSVMKGERLEAFAHQNNLLRITIADLIAYRQAREKLVERVGTFPMETAIGTVQGYAYTTPFDSVNHFAFVYGDITGEGPVPARFHRANVIADTFGGGKVIHAALSHFAAQGCGILVYLRDGTAGVPLTSHTHHEPSDTEASRVKAWREVGLGAQILKDLGVTRIRHVTTSQRSFVGLTGFGIDIVGTDLLDAL
jgi:3,4-dihydroxy 2-butanone 4-phosphate synthase / GTP cyclohydrolase II